MSAFDPAQLPPPPPAAPPPPPPPPLPPMSPPYGYAPHAYGYGFPPPMAPPFMAARPRSPRLTAAGALFILLTVRDLFFLVAVSIWQLERQTLGTNQDFPMALVQEPLLNAAILGVGAFMAAFAALCALGRTRHFLGWIAGACAAAACITPGLFSGFGAAGLVMGAIGVLIVWLSRAEFAPPSDPSAFGHPAPAP